MHEIGNHQDFGQAERGVVADEEESSVAREIRQSVDVGLAQVDNRVEATRYPKDPRLQALYAVGLIDEVVGALRVSGILGLHRLAHLNPICRRCGVPSMVTTN